MASGRINRNVLIYISGGSGCTPSEANTTCCTIQLAVSHIDSYIDVNYCMGPWAHIRFHLDGGPQGWNPHGASGSLDGRAL